KLRKAARAPKELGDLRGLLFGNGERFLLDLSFQLELRAAYTNFVESSTKGNNLESSFRAFVAATEAWEDRHGYPNAWYWPGLSESLRRLHSPIIDRTLDSEDFERNSEMCRKRRSG